MYVSVKEDTGTFTLTVELSPAATKPVTVAYTTGDGTATSSDDYIPAAGTLTFDAGETSKVRAWGMQECVQELCV